MSISEISLLAVVALLVIYRGWVGWRGGATAEVRILLVNLFGVLVAVRYWQPWSEKIGEAVTFDPRWVATGAFLALYLVGAAVAGFVVRIKAQAYQSVKADYLNQGLGLAAGVFSGLLLGACVAWITAIARPADADSMAAMGSLRAWPRALVQSFETAVGVAPGSPGRTRYPQVTLVEAPVEPNADLAAGGAVLMRQKGQIDWR
jgi:uncharacterized membrane protein required for colicin V production